MNLFQYKLEFMCVALFFWFFPAFVSIVYLITSAVYTDLYANWYLIVCANLFLAFYIACVLATDSMSIADASDRSNDPQLSVSYKAAAKEKGQDSLINA